MQKIVTYSLLCVLLLFNLTIALGSNQKTVIYDISQMEENDLYVLPLPEIKIRFDDLAEQFEVGDKLSIRMIPANTNESTVSWYYPPTLNKSGPLAKRIIKKITRYRLESRIDNISIRSRTIPVPKLRVTSRDIEGNARSKVSPLYQFGSEDHKSIEIDILESLEQDDVLRLKGLYIGIKKISTIGTTNYQYKKNNGQWLPLNMESYLVGSAKITSSSKNRFLRIKDHIYHPSIYIETGEISSLRSGNNLKLLLSDEFEGRWFDDGPQRIQIESEGRKYSLTVTPSIHDKEIIFPLADLDYNQSKISFPDLKFQCISSATDPLTQGIVSMWSNLSSSLLVDESSEFSLLDQLLDPIICMNPQVEVLGGKYRSFFKTDSLSHIDIQIRPEAGGKLIPGDTIRLVLPANYPISWAWPKDDSRNLNRVINVDEKTLGIIVNSDIKDNLNLYSLSLSMPDESIPPFNLSAVYPFLSNMRGQIVKNDLRYGHIQINLEESQMVNTNTEGNSLKRIVVQEDMDVKMSQRGDIIQIIASEDKFNFDLINLNKIELKNVDHSNNLKLAINYSNSNQYKIMLNILAPLELGEKVYIENIPIQNIHEKLDEIHLNYQINEGGIQSDLNTIDMIYAHAEFEGDNKFVRDVNSTPQLLSLSNLHIDLMNIPRYGQNDQFVILRLPSGIASWASNQKPKIDSTNQIHIEYINKREIAIYAMGDIGKKTHIEISGLNIIPDRSEFIGQELTCLLVADSSIVFSTKPTISYTYPTFRSIGDQTFFTDDTTWNVYDLEINTGNLDMPILPGDYIELIISDHEIFWDRGANQLSDLASNNGLLSRNVIFDGSTCQIVAADTIKDNTQLRISGLRIKPLSLAASPFSLEMSLDGGRTICAEDYEGKTTKAVKLRDEISEKVNRAIQENIYSMETGRTIALKIPEGSPLKWDESIDSIQRVSINNETQIQKGDINFSVLDERVTYPNKKTVLLKIGQGYGSKDQGLRLSGPNRKKLYFKGLKLLDMAESEGVSDNEEWLNLIIESPYGPKTENGSSTGWQLLVNGKIKNYLMTDDFQSTEFVLMTPQISKFNGREVFEDRKLQLYAEEHVLLRSPLVDFENMNSEVAYNNLESCLKNIVALYSDTYPKGKNWKTWYYLAWLKKRSIELNVQDKILELDLVKNERALIKSSYSEDMETAKIHGYSPLTRHQNYPSIGMGTLISDINAKIDVAVLKFSHHSILDAEDELLMIRREVLGDQKLKYLTAKIDYWLARIGISLDDSEYQTFQQSYTFQKLKNARSIYSGNAPLFTRDLWLRDSINVYSDIAIDQVNISGEKKLANLTFKSARSVLSDLQISSYEFYFGDDYSYAITLKGLDRANIALINSEDKSKIIYQDEVMSPTFGQTLRFSKGGEYEIRFSPARQTMYNIILSSIILSSIGLIYAQ